MEDHISRVLTKMDSEEEKLRYLGFLGIFKESFKIIFSWKKIFTQLTLAFILPLAVIFLIQIPVSENLEARMRFVRYRLYHYRDNERADEFLSSERIEYWLIKIAYLVFLLALSLLATSAVVYTVACNYTGKPITFKKVMSVVPKVWKRVAVTFVWSFLFHLAFSLCVLGTFVMWAILIGSSPFGLAIGVIILILFFVGFVYLSIVCQLASVVSVLEEENYGIKAMVKSKSLIEGKRRVTGFIFLLLILLNNGIVIVYRMFVWAFLFMLIVGAPCLFVLTFLFLFGLVIQTIIYFVCKSYHCESIDKPALANHLEAYFQPEPQKQDANDVQLEQVHVPTKDARLGQVYV
ncbi:uncharacterized protein LOC125312779 [Rhodamnia argentea]|uniref:Uncharacterized protein LOC125312779 n=1 Tax=Rhodamnia argentea TaxID=178133 RepID=A0ABM3GUY7_9MYRT|nr:uncharacterized protein LOC125312779 [Rhodamnia argentea]